MLSKEQIKQIENNKKLFKFINILLNEMDKKGEREMVIVFENGRITINEDIVELQARFNTTNIESILLSVLKGEVEND